MLWVKNPIGRNGIAHGIWDPHHRFLISQKIFSMLKTSVHTIVLSYSGNWLYTVGFNCVSQIYNFVIVLELLAVISIPLAKVDSLFNCSLLQWLTKNPGVSSIFHESLMPNGYYHSFGKRLNCHTAISIGFASTWCGHLLELSTTNCQTMCFSIH